MIQGNSNSTLNIYFANNISDQSSTRVAMKTEGIIFSTPVIRMNSELLKIPIVNQTPFTIFNY